MSVSFVSVGETIPGYEVPVAAEANPQCGFEEIYNLFHRNPGQICPDGAQAVVRALMS